MFNLIRGPRRTKRQFKGKERRQSILRGESHTQKRAVTTQLGTQLRGSAYSAPSGPAGLLLRCGQQRAAGASRRTLAHRRLVLQSLRSQLRQILLPAPEAHESGVSHPLNTGEF